MLQTFKNGQGSIILRVKLQDSSQTDGRGLTGLTSASSGLRISTIADNEATATAYTVAGSTIETITTLGTYAAPTATKCRFKEVDSTNHKGLYELHIADARFAVSNAKSLIVSLSGATNLVEADFVVQLQSDDPYVAKPTNSQLLSIDSDGRVDVIKLAGTTQTARDIGASVLLSNGTGAGQLKLASGYVAMTWADVAAPTTTLALTGTTIAATQKVDVETIKTQAVTAAAGVTFPASIASPTNITAGTITTVTNLTNAATSGDFTATMKASIGTAVAASAVASVTGNVGGNLAGSIGSVASGGITAASFGAAAIDAAAIATDAIGALELAAGAASEIATAVRTELATELGRIDAAVTSRASQSSVDTVDDLLDTEVAAIKTVTDKLDTMLQAASGSPGDWEYRADALRRAPTGSGGSGGGPSETDIANAVWSWAGRTLTALDEDSTTIDLDNLIRSALGLGSANLDTQLGALPTAIENADALLDRDMSAGTDSGSPTVRTPRQALRILRNKWSISGSTQTITKEDDTTASWTQVLSTTPGADPVTGVDPA